MNFDDPSVQPAIQTLLAHVPEEARESVAAELPALMALAYDIFEDPSPTHEGERAKAMLRIGHAFEKAVGGELGIETVARFEKLTMQAAAALLALQHIAETALLIMKKSRKTSTGTLLQEV